MSLRLYSRSRIRDGEIRKVKLHTGGLYLTNYVTFEGNWLHQILFRGFIAKGMNTYARTTFQFFILYYLLKQVHFFLFTNLDDFVYVHYNKSK